MIEQRPVEANWKVLVVDDQIGANPEMQLEFAATLGVPIDSLHFATGQVERRNDIESVLRLVSDGWPSADSSRWSLIYLDIRFDQMPRTSNDASFGFVLLERLREKFGFELPIVILTSEDEAKKTRSNRSDATSFLPKPTRWAPGTCANEHRELLKRYGMFPDESGRCLGTSLIFLQVLRRLRSLAVTGEKNILLLGESGSGKSWLAQFVHEATGRLGPFRQAFADPANPDMEATRLFGQWHGAYTGAPDGNFAGEAEWAHRGTLFLDEIAELSPKTQAQLLEFRDTIKAGSYEGWRRIERRGHYEAGVQWAKLVRSTLRQGRWEDHLNLIGDWDESLSRVVVNSVLVSATNKNIADATIRKEIGFRDDLAFAIAPETATITVPSLRERRDEVSMLFMRLMSRRRAKRGAPAVSLDRDAAAALKEFDWPGNFRQMDSVVRSVDEALGTFTEIFVSRLPTFVRDPQRTTPRVDNAVGEVPDAPSVSSGKPSDAYNAQIGNLAELEVQLMEKQVDALRACFADMVRANPLSVPELKPVMQRLYGVELQAADPKRELKRMLDPLLGESGSAAVRRKLGRLPPFTELMERCRTDVVIVALHEYATERITWSDAAARISATLVSGR